MLPKKRDAVKDIQELLLERFTEPGQRGAKQPRVQCGIIYCLSRAECERVAEALGEAFRTSGVTLAIR